MENEGISFNWGMAEQIVVYVGDGILLCQRNNKLEESHVKWNDLQELMQSERSRTRRTLYTEIDTRYTVVQSNIIDFTTSSCNARTQNNVEGLLKKKATHIQRKNCGSSNRRKTTA